MKDIIKDKLKILKGKIINFTFYRHGTGTMEYTNV